MITFRQYCTEESVARKLRPVPNLEKRDIVRAWLGFELDVHQRQQLADKLKPRLTTPLHHAVANTLLKGYPSPFRPLILAKDYPGVDPTHLEAVRDEVIYHLYRAGASMGLV